MARLCAQPSVCHQRLLLPILQVICLIRCAAANVGNDGRQPRCESALLQASTHRSALQTILVQEPAKPENKILAEGLMVLTGLAVLLCCFRMRWNPLEFFHHQSEDVAEIREGASPEKDAESDNEDWTVEQMIGAQASGPGCDDHKEEAHDPDVIPKYLDLHYSSFKLLFQLLLTLGQFWAALIYMYWSLLYGDEEMMNCEAYPKDAKRAFFVIHACHYTRACLHGFPVIAANIILVLMIRSLLQHRLYYSMLRGGYLIVFQSIPILHTVWPLAIALSMLQGALHFVLKAYFAPEQQTILMVFRLIRKFVLPGGIFFMILIRYADVENTLVPLNHIAELEANEVQHHSPWLTKLKIMNERVLAFDVRHRDVFADVLAELARAPTIEDIFKNVIANYDVAKERWHARAHRQWGLFRSMWPAALLLDRRFDLNDEFTRTWLVTCGILAVGSLITSLFSVYLLVCHTAHLDWSSFAGSIGSLFTKGYLSNSGHVLVNVIVIWHAGLIVIFVYHTIHNMFYFEFTQDEIAHATHRNFLVQRPISEADKAAKQREINKSLTVNSAATQPSQ